MKIISRLGSQIGSGATDGEIFFVVPLAANSIQNIYFASVDRTRAQDFILAWEWSGQIRPVPGV